MAIDAISAISNTKGYDAAQAAGMNNNQITAMLTSGNMDPKFATLLINQMASNNVNSILFGNPSGGSSGSDSSFDPFGGMSDLGVTGVSGSGNNDIFGTSSMNNYITPQFEISVYSSLIGKTVTASDPLTNVNITGKVVAVTVQNGKAALNINGQIVPTANLISIKE